MIKNGAVEAEFVGVQLAPASASSSSSPTLCMSVQVSNKTEVDLSSACSFSPISRKAAIAQYALRLRTIFERVASMPGSTSPGGRAPWESPSDST